jgi:Zn-finger nucleic acid-binding protein
MTATATDTCMKCGGQMRPYERSGLVVEQCEDCRAMFLDQGELERLIDAEGGGWSGRVGAPSAIEHERASGEPIAAMHRRPQRPTPA